MRCYFKKGARIMAVEFLTRTEDRERIAEAAALFAARGQPNGADGYEVWDGARFVYCFPEIDAPTA